ncbi:MAG: tRNA pseudouridine(38-40) synthase TruA [Balneola sp.]
MARYKLTIEYNGAGFSGWQIQPDARTVEGELEKAFSQILQRDVDLLGQGRTDAGVHARGQVAHVDIEGVADFQKLIFGVNGLTGNEVHIHEFEEVHPEFHARFDATSREYAYTILKKPSPLQNHMAWAQLGMLDSKLLHKCASLLNGEFDFAGFSKYNEENYTTLCTIFRSEFEELEDRWIYHISANRFLRNMVRRITGTMAEVAKGKLTYVEFAELLNNPESNVKSFTAPAKGLVLEKVFY